MKVVIDCDDAAIGLKKVIIEHLEKSGVEVTDLDYLGTKADAGKKRARVTPCNFCI